MLAQQRAGKSEARTADTHFVAASTDQHKSADLDEVEPYDGSYACLICTDSVRGEPALVCWECNSNPWHRKCDKDSKLSRCAPHVIRCQ